MKTLTRRLITLLLCCWLPLPGVALATIDCHLLSSAMATQAKLDSDQANKQSQPADEHSGCGGVKKSTQNTADVQTLCAHCQMACHNAQFLLAPGKMFSLLPEPNPAPDYASSLPKVVFIHQPQRPPQAV